jgi:hypothetical protein
MVVLAIWVCTCRRFIKLMLFELGSYFFRIYSRRFFCVQMMLKEVEDNLTLLQQIKENNMMVNMKAHNLMEDHNHQLENA